jgi:RNA polymerase sigma-70 factor, ECF subfamily
MDDGGYPGPVDDGLERSLAHGGAPAGDLLHRLVDQARQGDERAWEALFRRSYPRLLAYATRRLPTVEQAQEAVGETMTRAVAHIGRLREEGGGFDAWMYGILRHVVLDAQRFSARESPGLVPDTVDIRLEPVEWTLEREDAAEVRAAFDQLSAADQELLELRVVAGLSVDQVATALGRRPGAIRMAQSRALTRLRAHLALEQAGEETGA